MHPKPITILLVCLLGITSYAQDVIKKEIDIPAQANVYYAEMLNMPYVSGGRGIESIVFDVRNIRMITFDNVSGEVSCFGDSANTYFGADGGTYGYATEVAGIYQLSGIHHSKKVMFVCGVFTNEESRLDEAYPPTEVDGHENEQINQPGLNQTFFIGDGKTDDGEVQQFIVPEGAEQLYIGFADCLRGPPGRYDDNKGSIKMTVSLHPYDKGKN